MRNIFFCTNMYYLSVIFYHLAFMDDYDHAVLYYYEWLKRETVSIKQAHRVISLYESAMNGMRNYIIGSIAKFDVFLIIVSIVLSIQVHKKYFQVFCSYYF